MNSSPDYQFILEILGDLDLPARRFYLAEGEYVVGASASADICIPADTISRRHARFSVLKEGGVILQDTNSTNGSFVERTRIQKKLITSQSLLGFGHVEANLIPASRDAGIAIAARNLPLPATPTPPGNVDLSTVQATPNSQLMASLGRHCQALLHREIRAEEFARRLIDNWQTLTGASAMEISRRNAEGEELVLNRSGARITATTPDMDIIHPSGLHFRIWQPLPASGMEIEALGRLALDILSGCRQQEPILPQPTETSPPLPGVGSRNERVKKLYASCRKIAKGSIPVLILGESGTGKEVLARWIHEQSGRQGAFVTLNCATLGRDLLEAELFGVEKGAATGVEARPGILERANGGTVFLDEVGEMPPEIQARLLRALEDTSIYRVGGKNPVPVEVRFLAATNRPLEENLGEEGFRLDLFHRLAAFDITLPPLRERREDIPQLAAFFFENAARNAGVGTPGITRGALSRLLDHDWPGNIRELRNEMERAVLLLDPGEPLDQGHFSTRILSKKQPATDLSLEHAVRKAEREAFRIALAVTDGDPGKAMEILGLSRTSYYRKLKQLGLATG
ncbi:sigma 54-interacting transcriptional regulator [Thiolapillus sp.]